MRTIRAVARTLANVSWSMSRCGMHRTIVFWVSSTAAYGRLTETNGVASKCDAMRSASVLGSHTLVPGAVKFLCTTMIPATLFSLLAFGLVPFTASTPTSSSRGEPAHFPITRRSLKARGLNDLASAADNLRAKYNFPTVGAKQKRAGTTAAVSLVNQVG